MTINRKKLKRIITVYAIVMFCAFIVGVIFFSTRASQGNAGMVADLDSATFPEITFSYQGYTVNHLTGYAREMELTSVRDTITPVNKQQIDININAHDATIHDLTADVYTLDGKENVYHQEIETPDEEVNLTFDSAKIVNTEHVLKLTLNIGSQEVYYYTRIKTDADTHLASILDYAYSFHNDAIDKNEDSSIEKALESSGTDATSFEHVTITSDYDHVTYGSLSPEVEGVECWQIKEMNTVTCSLAVEYQLECDGNTDDEDALLDATPDSAEKGQEEETEDGTDSEEEEEEDAEDSETDSDEEESSGETVGEITAKGDLQEEYEKEQSEAEDAVVSGENPEDNTDADSSEDTDQQAASGESGTDVSSESASGESVSGDEASGDEASADSSDDADSSVESKDEQSDTGTYNCDEFFRIRYKSKKSILLLDYDRTMDQIYEVADSRVDSTGILLGVADSDVNYITNKKENVVAFVQAGELWCYNKASGEMSQVFSFASSENKDTRNKTHKYDIRLMNMDSKGNFCFAVVGYMNRGEHEGEVGIAVYQFDISDSTVAEKAFLSTDRSADYAEVVMSKFVYYSSDLGYLYTVANGTLYEYDANKNRMYTMKENLASDQYVTSEDGKYVAYVETTDNGSSLIVRNLNKDTKRVIKCDRKERYIPLGFMSSDVVYGVTNDDSLAKTETGEEQSGMYKVEIQNTKGKVVKTYEEDGIYVLDASFDKNMITLNRATLKDGLFKTIADEYITYNEGEDESSISISAYYTDLQENQVEIKFADGLTSSKLSLLCPKHQITGKETEYAFETQDKATEYYVYGYGKMRGVYEKAGEAIAQADSYNGVVVSSSQKYVWERGNRDLAYQISTENKNLQEIRSALNGGKSASDALSSVYGKKNVYDLSGCTLEELMYIIDHDRPIIAMTGDSKCVLIIGYTEATVTYMDPASGDLKNVGLSKFLKYAKDGNEIYRG